MERRYLVAALAIVATFAVTSHGFRVLQRVALAHEHGSWSAGTSKLAKCESPAAARVMSKLSTHLRPRYPEEAQLLAEMNVPIADMDAKIAEQMAQQAESVSQCARARAMQEAARARRDALHSQRDAMRAVRESSLSPISLDMNIPLDLDQRMTAKMAALSARLAANSARLEIATEKLRQMPVQIDLTDVPMAYVTDDGGKMSARVHTHVHVRCNVSDDQPHAQ